MAPSNPGPSAACSAAPREWCRRELVGPLGWVVPCNPSLIIAVLRGMSAGGGGTDDCQLAEEDKTLDDEVNLEAEGPAENCVGQFGGFYSF